jgi:hypothetical protein
MRFPPLKPYSDVPAAPAGQMAETDQYTRARAALSVSLAGRPIDNRNLSGHPSFGIYGETYADVRSPQHFVMHPAIVDAVETTAVGLETAATHLPGRQSYAGWDGESGATSPTAGAT